MENIRIEGLVVIKGFFCSSSLAVGVALGDLIWQFEV